MSDRPSSSRESAAPPNLVRTSPGAAQKPRLLEQVRHALRLRHYSLRTEEAYLQWIRRFIVYHGKRHPSEMGADEVHAFLTHLAVEGEVAPSTQNQALNAVVFLYKQVLEIELGDFSQFTRAKRPKKLPVVLTRDEVARLIEQIKPPFALMATLLYGSGLRLMDCLRLRVKDLDFTYRQIVVRDGKGNSRGDWREPRQTANAARGRVRREASDESTIE